MQEEMRKQTPAGSSVAVYYKQWDLSSGSGAPPIHLETPHDSLPLTGFDPGSMDSYTAGIELSNACRKHYVDKEKTAETLKRTLIQPLPSLYDASDDVTRSRTSRDKQTEKVCPLQQKMAHLKEELVSLIDMDLALMRQFLLLNEQIEELKWQRKMHTYKLHNTASFKASTCSGGGGSRVMATWSRSTMSSSTDSRMLSAEYLDFKYPSPSELSLFNACYSTTETLSPSNLDLRLQDVGEEVGEVTSDLGSDPDTLDKPRGRSASRDEPRARDHECVASQDCPRTPTRERFNSSLNDHRLKPISLWPPPRGDQSECDYKKSSTMASTGSNESTSTESNSVDSGISDHELTVEFVQNI